MSGTLAVATAQELHLSMVARTYEAFLMGIVYWDWISSLKAEYHHIWKKRWTFTKFLYVVARYVCIAFTTAVMVSQQASLKFNCNRLVRINCIALIIIQTVATTVLTQRAYVVSQRRAWVLVALVPCILSTIAVGVVHATISVTGDHVMLGEGGQTQCRLMLQKGSQVMTEFFLALPLCANTIATGIVVTYAWLNLPRGTPLQRILLLDGLLYLFAVGGIGLVQLLFFSLTELPGMRMLNAPALASLTSVFCCRLILHLRQESTSITSNPGTHFPAADWDNSWTKPSISTIIEQKLTRSRKDKSKAEKNAARRQVRSVDTGCISWQGDVEKLERQRTAASHQDAITVHLQTEVLVDEPTTAEKEWAKEHPQFNLDSLQVPHLTMACLPRPQGSRSTHGL